MAFVCSATWTAKPGEEDTVRDALSHLSPAARQEPGNLYYQAYQSPEEPAVFRIFEVYTDEDAFTAHVNSEHFDQWGTSQAIPALAERAHKTYETLDF
ncbi:putative quinol monooxygenase [Kocuria marina]|uniref:putative quinol monooxygenase n=1 Tax=Kocuria marina TaxID=223184 RepID=UPI0011A544C2|nr:MULTISPECIES: putative quinol monooxygenase [Kocuria]MCT2020765.1 antibiotic biosynthesis monooxygenase [Kocuria marina]